MTRKLFAFLALLSGLAALSSAATVSYAHNSSQCNASVSANATSVATSEHRQAKPAPGKVSARANDTSQKKTAPVPQSLRMPVLMGIDRAHE